MSDNYIEKVKAATSDLARVGKHVITFRDKAEYYVEAQTCASACVLAAWHRYINEGERHDKCLKVMKCEVLPCDLPEEKRGRYFLAMV